jgi:hypothetical protein
MRRAQKAVAPDMVEDGKIVRREAQRDVCPLEARSSRM